MIFCSIEGCGVALTDVQAATTQKLFGQSVCSTHERAAALHADKHTNAFTIETGPYVKHGFEIKNGQAVKRVDEFEISIDIARIAQGKTKKESIMINGYEYCHGINSGVDKAIKTLFDELKGRTGGHMKKEEPGTQQPPKPEQEQKMAPRKPIAQDAHETALAKIRDVELTPESIIKYLCPDATLEEAVLFLQVCKHRNLNPFIPGEVFLIKYDKIQPASTVVGKYAFTKKADAHKDFKGFSAGIIVRNINGEIEEREGTFYLPKGKNTKEDEVYEVLLGGWASVERENRRDFVEKVSLQECMKYTKDGQPTRSWREQPATLIRKNALVRALREAFPAELGGLYEISEMQEV